MTTYESLLKNPDFKKKSVLETLIKEYTHLTREEIWIHLNDPIDEKTLQLILDGYHQYIEDKKPLEYIVGHVDFFGKEFYVNEHTIIPRPETEYMVRAVSNWISIDTSKQQKKTYTLLDIGT
ncbi:hypothetical protein J5893_00015 [bacterium]|nr:hypothetical protein [bacterium]